MVQSADARRRNSLRLLCYHRARLAASRGLVRLAADWFAFGESV